MPGAARGEDWARYRPRHTRGGSSGQGGSEPAAAPGFSLHIPAGSRCRCVRRHGGPGNGSAGGKGGRNSTAMAPGAPFFPAPHFYQLVAACRRLAELAAGVPIASTRLKRTRRGKGTSISSEEAVMVFVSQIVAWCGWSSYGAGRVRSSGKTTNVCCCPRKGFKIQQAVSAKTESLGFYRTVKSPVIVQRFASPSGTKRNPAKCHKFLLCLMLIHCIARRHIHTHRCGPRCITDELTNRINSDVL
jgi:hypothetical protein